MNSMGLISQKRFPPQRYPTHYLWDLSLKYPFVHLYVNLGYQVRSLHETSSIDTAIHSYIPNFLQCEVNLQLAITGSIHLKISENTLYSLLPKDLPFMKYSSLQCQVLHFFRRGRKESGGSLLWFGFKAWQQAIIFFFGVRFRLRLFWLGSNDC